MAPRRERGLFDADAAAGESPFDHTIWVIASDGDLQEGVTAEASSLAGHQELGNLVVLYDDNQISIEDDTDIAFSEDVLQALRGVRLARPARRLDHDRRVRRGRPGAVRRRSRRRRRRPTAVVHLAAHDHRLAGPERRRTPARSTAPRWAPRRSPPPRRCSASTRSRVRGRRRRPGARPRGRRARQAGPRASGTAAFQAWRAANPERAAEFDRVAGRRTARRAGSRRCPVSPRQGRVHPSASGKVLKALGPVLPELWGGSADLAGSNNTTIEGAPSFLPGRGNRRCRATRTAARCTSASASTPWAST